MEYLDFSSVITTMRKYINDERTVMDRLLHEEVKIDQMHLLDQVFASFCDDEDSLDYAFDNGQVCRWFNGQARISPRIISFYMNEENRDLLSADIEFNVLPLMYDSAMAAQDVHTLLLQDTTISHEAKNKLLENYPCHSDRDKADFLAATLFFGMEREFRKRDAGNKALLASGSFSPVLRDFVFGAKVPRPCRHFCGRDSELKTLHNLLCSQGKVFLQGIAGIGKSELAKAYAKKYDKEYTNILYITYSGDLKKDIVNLDFADDVDDKET
ncbi:MAG: ATP-binding protein, partial [Clostridia bacterium]|nr:ATP-binding protein [Clostridia bacterium]